MREENIEPKTSALTDEPQSQSPDNRKKTYTARLDESFVQAEMERTGTKTFVALLEHVFAENSCLRLETSENSPETKLKYEALVKVVRKAATFLLEKLPQVS